MFHKYFFVVLAHIGSTVFVLKTLCSVLPHSLAICYSATVNCILCLIIARFTFHFTKRIFFGGKVQPRYKAVLITGCDHGFGHMLAKQLDETGFHVFAGCLDPSGVGADELRNYCSDRLEILRLDVRKEDNVKESADFVKKKLVTSDLWAIVNNAGIAQGISADLSTLQDFKECMDVNLFGTVRVTKAFLPLLKLSRGRIVNVTSLGGKLGMANLTPYCVSKFAAVGFSECLRQEMDVWGIRVISVEPESFRTAIVDWDVVGKRMDEQFSSLPDDVKAEYGDLYFKKLKSAAFKYTKSTSTKVENVVHDLELAVSLEYPDVIYRPCRNIYTYALLYCFEYMPIIARDFSIKCFLYMQGFPIPKIVR